MKTEALSIAALACTVLMAMVHSQSQSFATSEENAPRIEIPSGTRTWRPKLSLQDAMKIADNFMVSEKIDTTHFWLYQAKYTLYGGSARPDKHKTPGWFFW